MKRLGTIRVPTLVLVGADDILTPPAFSRALAKLIRRARLQILPSGHAFFLEHAEHFNRRFGSPPVDPARPSGP